MKNLFFYMVIYCLSGMVLIAQPNNKFRGKILFMNSDKTPAVGVRVSGDIPDIGRANQVYTTNNGLCQLLFREAAVGRQVKLTIGKTDSNGQEIELVNEKAINNARVPAIVTYEFEIIVAKKGERDSVAIKYFGIFKTSAQRELEKLNKRINRLKAKRKKNRKAIRALEDRRAKLERQTDSIAMYREAYRLASINRDNASKRVVKYLKLLDEGKSVQEAREVLSVEAAAEELHESISNFRAGVKELEYRAYASKSLFDYEDAINTYSEIIIVLEGMEIDRAVKAHYYGELAAVYLKNGKYEAALDSQQRVIDSLNRILDPRNPGWATAYNATGAIYHALEQPDTALSYHRKAIAIQKKVLNAKHPDLATSYDYMALAYQALGRYRKALNHHKRSIRIREKVLNPQHSDLATAYHHMALPHQARGKYKKALEYHRKAIVIREAILDAVHPDLGLSYMHMGITYAAMKEYQTAIPLLEKSLVVFKESLDETHPYAQKALSTIGLVYARNKQFKEAHNAFTEYEKLFPKEGRPYRNRAMYYALQNDKEKALINLQKAVELGYKDIKWLKTDDSMDSLRNEKVFIELVRKLEKQKRN